jgi:hypothetical protein
MRSNPSGKKREVGPQLVIDRPVIKVVTVAWDREQYDSLKDLYYWAVKNGQRRFTIWLKLTPETPDDMWKPVEISKPYAYYILKYLEKTYGQDSLHYD